MDKSSDEHSFINSNTAVSPIVGYILLIGFVLLAATSLFIVGQGFLDSGADEPRIDANFEIEFNESNLNLSIVYDTGDTFDTSNTERLWVNANVIEGNTRVTKNITIYNESGVQFGDPNQDPTILIEGDTALNEQKAFKENISAGTPMRIFWKPADTDGEFILIIDEFVGGASVPVNVDVGTIDGTIAFGEGNIIYNGTSP